MEDSVTRRWPWLCYRSTKRDSKNVIVINELLFSLDSNRWIFEKMWNDGRVFCESCVRNIVRRGPQQQLVKHWDDTVSYDDFSHKKKMAVVKQICEHFTPMKPRNALLSTVAVPRTSSRADVTQCIFFTAGEQNLIALTPPTVHERLCIGFTRVPQIRERRQVWLSALHFLNAIWLNQNQSGWKSQPY